MAKWNQSKRAKTSLIGDVDCTSDKGKPLCERVGVQGYPTLKWGDPNNLEAYEGGRELKDLKEFAKKNLKPQCSPANIDLCDEEKKKKIGELQALSAEDLDAQIAEKEKKMEEAEETFKSEVEKLQKTYEQLQKDKDAAVAEVKES